jgi:hypothetical protein
MELTPSIADLTPDDMLLFISAVAELNDPATLE